MKYPQQRESPKWTRGQTRDHVHAKKTTATDSLQNAVAAGPPARGCRQTEVQRSEGELTQSSVFRARCVYGAHTKMREYQAGKVRVPGLQSQITTTYSGAKRRRRSQHAKQKREKPGQYV